MSDNFYPHRDLYPESKNRLHDNAVDLYESSVSCNRCGACIKVCPSYQLYKFENYSPRGRNQLLRLIFENKIKIKHNKKYILKSAASCLQCGRCAAMCAASTPTALHMRELIRTIAPYRNSAYTMLRVYFFKTYYFLRTLFVKLPKFNKKEQPKAVYMPNAKSPQIMPDVIALINKQYPNTAILKSGMMLSKTAACGTVPQKEKILKNIKKEFDLLSQKADIPLFTDSAEDFALLETCPLFKDMQIRFIGNIKKDIALKDKYKGKKVALLYNNLFRLAPDNNSEITSVFDCGNKLFFVKLDKDYIPSLGLLPFKYFKDKKALNNLISERIKKVNPDIIVTVSAYDYIYLKALAGKDANVTIRHIATF